MIGERLTVTMIKLNILAIIVLSAIFDDICTGSPSSYSSKAVAMNLRLLTLLPADRDLATSGTSISDYSSVALRLALDLATEQINNRSDLLPRYTLELIHREEGCTVATSTTVALTTGLFPRDGSRVAGVIGPVCSLDSLLVSSIVSRSELQLVLLHSAGSSLKLSDTSSSATNTLDILGSTQPLVDLAIALIKQTAWHNIAILFENNQPFYTSITESFISAVQSESELNIRYVSSVAPDFYPLGDVWNSKARIVFVVTSAVHSRRIMCLAHHLKLVYPDYQWIITNQKLDDFMGEDIVHPYLGNEYRCSYELLINSSLERTVLINFQLTSVEPDEPTIAETTFEGFLELYERRVNSYNSEHPAATVSPTYWSYHLYDAVWAWAIVLHEVLLEDKDVVFDYGNQTLANIILDKFYSLQFQGISGTINFNTINSLRMGGHLDRPANLYQIVSGEELHITHHNGTYIMPLKYIDTVSDIVINFNLPHRGIVAFFLTIQCINLAFVLVLHLCTFMYRDATLVKASSPKLIHAAFFGVYTFILTMTLYTLYFIKVHSPVVSVFFCQAVWAWFMPLSFTVSMGIVSLRTWRLYRIFKHYLNPGKLITNPALLVMLLMMISVDLIIATLWTALDTNQFYFVEFTPDNSKTNEVYYDTTCLSQYNTLWIGIIFAYKFVLLLGMVVLSLLTRNIPNQAFSTTLLRVFSYSFSFVMVVGFMLYFVFFYLDNHSNISTISLCTAMNLMLLLFIFCILVPPLTPVIKHPWKTNMQTL